MLQVDYNGHHRVLVSFRRWWWFFFFFFFRLLMMKNTMRLGWPHHITSQSQFGELVGWAPKMNRFLNKGPKRRRKKKRKKDYQKKYVRLIFSCCLWFSLSLTLSVCNERKKEKNRIAVEGGGEERVWPLKCFRVKREKEKKKRREKKIK